MEKNIHYAMLSKVTPSDLEGVAFINVVLDETKPKETSLCILKHADGKFERFETYDSLTEFSTVAMKELLLLHVKRAIIEHDPEYFTADDPRLHAFLSKLSYSNIQTVCGSISQFAEQFKNKKITLLVAPKTKKFNKK
jgi:hypothetical protein